MGDKIMMPDYHAKVPGVMKKAEPRSTTKISMPLPKIGMDGKDCKSMGNGKMRSDIPLCGDH